MPKSFLCCILGSRNVVGDHVNTIITTSSSEARQAGGNSGINSNVHRRMGTPYMFGDHVDRVHKNARINQNNIYYDTNTYGVYIDRSNEHDSSLSNSSESTENYPRFINGSNGEQIHVENGDGGLAYREGRNLHVGGYRGDENLHVGGHRGDENRYDSGHRGDRNQAADVHREAQNGGAHFNDILNVGKFMPDGQKVPDVDSRSPILNGKKGISSAETLYSLGDGSHSSHETPKVPSGM